MWKHSIGIWSGNLSSLQSLHSHIFKLPTQSSTKGCIQSYVCIGIPGIRCLQGHLGKLFFKSYGKCQRFSFKLSLKQGYYGFWLEIWKIRNSFFTFTVRLQRQVNAFAKYNFTEHRTNKNKRFKREHFALKSTKGASIFSEVSPKSDNPSSQEPWRLWAPMLMWLIN